MSHLINISNDVYAELTRLKKAKDASYSEVIQKLLPTSENKKTETKGDLLDYLKTLEKKYKTKKKENISENIDQILYGR